MLLLAASRAARALSTRAACALTPASASAARESPTPVLLLGSASLPAGAFYASGLVGALAAAGFNVAVLPDATAARDADAAVDALERAVRALGAAPPVAVAHGVAATLAQLYLESFALAGAVLLAPLPPDARAALERRAGGGADDSSPLARALPRVKLEPSPVPLLALRAAGDAQCTAEDLAAVAAHHALDAAAARALPGADAALGLAGDARGSSGAAARDAIVEWIARRF